MSQEKLPDIFELYQQKRSIESVDEWWDIRRPEIKALFEEHIYGPWPEKPRDQSFEATVLSEGDGVRYEQISIRTGSAVIHLVLAIPTTTDKALPVILFLNPCGNHTLTDNPAVPVSEGFIDPEHIQKGWHERGSWTDRWNIDEIARQGFIAASFHQSDIVPDDAALAEPIRRLFSDAMPGNIMLWAWGLSRAVDALYSHELVDNGRIAVTGHSRRGKAALVAGAFDERIAAVISHQSGTGGSALSRNKPEQGESVRQINERFPHWFALKFHEYNDNEAVLPVDQHMLIALMAPRPVLITNAVDDLWADPDGSFVAMIEADKLYSYLGGQGLAQGSKEDFKPAAKLASFMRSGGHGTNDEDWSAFFAFLKFHLA